MRFLRNEKLSFLPSFLLLLLSDLDDLRLERKDLSFFVVCLQWTTSKLVRLDALQIPDQLVQFLDPD